MKWENTEIFASSMHCFFSVKKESALQHQWQLNLFEIYTQFSRKKKVFPNAIFVFLTEMV